jgi:cellulose synthase/poly-beta-1,6-N-acetylglucosamine synthase-like glycosyltransferase
LLLQIFCVFLLFIAALVCGYYWFLALYALISKKKFQKSVSKDPQHTFAIVIPAHNEEEVLAKTLESCGNMEYPRDKYKVFVIADNCSDNTANVSRKMGTICFERQDDRKKGKGYALAWAYEQILPLGYDAIVVLDADCFMDPFGLRVFDQYLAEGFRVLQANDVASNPDVNSMSYAVAVGNFIENDLFYYPKSQLCLAVFLRGTGIVLHRDILRDYPWEAHSVAEDMEYAVNLIKNGIRIRFVSEVNVLSEFPVHNEQLYVQRNRWASGNLSFGRKHALKMIWQGLIKKQWQIADAGWTFLVLSRPLVLLELITATAFAFLCVWIVPGSFSTILLFFALFLTALQGLYCTMGIVLLGVNSHRLKLLISTPFVVGRLIAISANSFFHNEKSDWVRTPR